MKGVKMELSDMEKLERLSELFSKVNKLFGEISDLVRPLSGSTQITEDETVGEVFATLTEKQKNVVYALIAEAYSGCKNSSFAD